MTSTALTIQDENRQAFLAKVLNDSIHNVAAQLNTGKSKLAGDAFSLVELGQIECTAMYRGDWLSRKIIDLPVTDARKAGRVWDTSQASTKVTVAAEKKWGTVAKLAEGFKMGRLYGGAVLLISVQGEDPRMPLKTIGRGQLKALTVLTPAEITPMEQDQDPTSPNYRLPKRYMIRSSNGYYAEVHHSRVIRFPGKIKPDRHLYLTGWDDPLLQSVYSAVHHAALTRTAIAELIHESKLDIIKVKNLTSLLANQVQADALARRFMAANALKSINNMLLLDLDGEQYERKQVAFTGMPDVLGMYLNIVAGAADIPATRLLGTSAKGLNATGEGDLQNYHESLESLQRDDMRPVDEAVDRILWLDAEGVDPPNDAYFEYGPVRTMTPEEKAALAKTKAETLKIHIDAGVFPAGEDLFDLIADGLIEDGTYPGLEVYRAKLRSAQIEQRETAEAAEAESATPAPGAADIRYFPKPAAGL